ncbi:MAG: tyrosine-protein phosphatase [Gemmataceae bacterium]|nr:tyrosine-protein phosphatase [Gemmataceae bacterium]
MDAPPPPRRSFTRRWLVRLLWVGPLAATTAEAVRVFAGTNRHTVVPGKVYRSAQLGPDALARVIEDEGIKTVVNLRGTGPEVAWYAAEARTTHEHGVCQEDVSLSAKRLPAPAEVRRLVEVLDRTAYPILLHCQQGADRTGLAAAAVLLLHTDATLARARRQLWPRYGHVQGGRTVVIDRFFDYYEAWLTATGQAHTPDHFRHWATREYCPGPYRAALSVVGPTPPTAPAGKGFVLTIRAANTSVEPWQLKPGAAGGVQLRYRLYSTGPAAAKVYTGHAGRLAATVKPGEHIDLAAGFPPVPAGKYLVHADLLDTQPVDILDADFVQYGSEPLVVDVAVK